MCSGNFLAVTRRPRFWKFSPDFEVRLAVEIADSLLLDLPAFDSFFFSKFDHPLLSLLPNG